MPHKVNSIFQNNLYTGKELDLTHGLNTYDHGARQNYSLLGVWDKVDPLAEKYYSISPYAVCGNIPISFFDLNGKIVHPSDSAAYNMILMTLNPIDQQNVILDKDGNIDFLIMSMHESDSQNYNELMEMAKSDLVFDVNLESQYTYSNNLGEI